MNNLGENLLRYKNKQKYLTFDWETCNLSLLPANNRGWQLGTLRHEGTTFIEKREDWLLWDDLMEYMSAGAAFITKFNIDEYKRRAKDPKPILERFEKGLYDPDTISITANGFGFDMYLNQISRNLLNKQTDWSFCKNLVCIQNLHKAIELGMTPPKIGTNEWVGFNIKAYSFHKRTFKTNVKYLCGVYDVEYMAERHHVESLYDADLTFQIFKKMLWRLDLEKI